jgi:asparagine synthase (glutamine-hydrolysing)
MCGFSIEGPMAPVASDRMAHRGLKKTELQVGKFKLTHFKLPFQTTLDDDFTQPIDLGDGSYLLYNGEIFNVPRGFKNDVDYLTHVFSKSDWIETIDVVSLGWDGFWAIAIAGPFGYYCFTDPLGKKQLYQSMDSLSSEIKPLLKEGYELNKDYQIDSEFLEDTPFVGIKRIIPNRLYYYFTENLISPLSSVSLGDCFPVTKSAHYISSTLRQKMKDAVVSRLINKGGSISVLVSGGLDSTIIVSILHELYLDGRLDLKAIDFLTIENGDDERYIKIVESYYGIEVRRIRIPEFIDFDDQIKEILKAYEHPIDLGSLIPQYYLCKKAKGNVIITGDGADELFSGYNRAYESDTQNYDVFTELPFYHNIRLDRMSMIFSKEIRSPFMGLEVIKEALKIPYDQRIGKRVLKLSYYLDVPMSIITRTKSPLRLSEYGMDKEQYKKRIKELFSTIKFI